MLSQVTCPACGAGWADTDVSCQACGFVNPPLAGGRRVDCLLGGHLDPFGVAFGRSGPCLCRLRIRGAAGPFSGWRSGPLPGLWRSLARPRRCHQKIRMSRLRPGSPAHRSNIEGKPSSARDADPSWDA